MNKAKLICVSGTLITALCGAQLAMAGPITANPDARHINVPVADLNLDNPQGLDALYNRLQQASRTVCGSTQIRAAGSARNVQQSQSCYDNSLSNAVTSLGIPALDAMHNG